MSFPIEAIRSQFPALTAAHGTVFFDNAAGAQLPSRVIDAVKDHLVHRMVQRGGPYPLSREVDSVIERARAAAADLVNAADANEIVFGLNGTSFMRLVSQTIAEERSDRNQIIVSELDHEANISVWLELQKRSGGSVKGSHGSQKRSAERRAFRRGSNKQNSLTHSVTLSKD